MAEEVNKYPQPQDEGDDSVKLQEWLYLCLGKWYWFLISLIVFLALAVLYILTATPSYVRTASILIKDEDNNNNISQQFGNLANFGMTRNRTNIYNEMISLKSPTYMLDVVKDLHLDMNYEIDGRFHSQVLYGKTLPVNVVLPDATEWDIVSFDLKLNPDGSLLLNKFVKNQEEKNGAVKGQLRTIMNTPVGKVVIYPTAYYVGKFDPVIHVSRLRPEMAARGYVGQLRVDLADDKSSVVDLRIEDRSPERADDILNELFVVYNNKWMEDINQQAISSSEFIDKELRQIEGELGNVDQDISSFKSQNLIPDVETASKLYMTKAEETETQKLDLSNQLYMAKYIKHQLTSEGSRNSLLPVNSGIDNVVVNNQIASYNEKLSQRNNLVANSSVNNPLVVDLDQELSATRRSIIASLDNVIATMNDRMGKLQSSSSETRQQIASNPNQAKYLLSVERQQKVKEELYVFLLQKREENQLSKVFTAYNTKLLNPPSGSATPAHPVKSRIMLVALFFGLLIPFVIVVIMHNLDTAVHNRKDLESLTIPFIGEIPLSYKKYHGLLAILNHRHKEVREIVVHDKGRNEINEAFRVIRTNLEFVSGKAGENKVIMLTSATVGSGKTFITINLATSFAIKGKRVVVVDLDLRKGSLSAFVKKPDTGIADYLNGRTEDIEEVMVKGKPGNTPDIIPVGTIPPNPTELLFSDRLEKALDELRERYDYVFIDCPPLEIVADSSIISKLCDMVVYVIRCEMFDRNMLPTVQRYYTEKRFKNMAIILNATTPESNSYGYHRYGYSYGYSYGYGNK